MLESIFPVFLAIVIVRMAFPIVAAIIACSDRSKGRRPSAAKAKTSAQRFSQAAAAAAQAFDTEVAQMAHEQARMAQEQARLANEQAMQAHMQAHMQAVQQHQQFVDEVNQQQFDQFSWQSVTPIDQGGFVPTSTSTGMF
ncbi:MAG: hypothetical protein VZQ75_07040 [Candidatus Faecousia sp.]|nr:hypothetical protein [Candidatus Faecousia sp.]